MMNSYLAQDKIADLRRDAEKARRARSVAPKAEPRSPRHPWTVRLRNRFAFV